MTITRKPRALDMGDVEMETDNLPQALPEPARALPPKRGFRFGKLFLGAMAGLITLSVSLWLTSLIQSLFAVGDIWGWLGSALAALAGFAALAVIMREGLALYRLRGLEKLQADAAAALSFNSRDSATAVSKTLNALYAGRADMNGPRAKLAAHAADIMDPSDRIRLAERELMLPLDATANAIIARAVKSVTLLTAVAPSPALDMLFVGAQNLSMLRQLATLYGGRPGTLAAVRLARLALGNLAVAGGLALSDQVLQHVLGKGLAGRLSARFGEGAVNGILTARIGLAACEVCRPLPYLAAKKPALGHFLAGLVKSGESE
jgi:putative membrane protein